MFTEGDRVKLVPARASQRPQLGNVLEYSPVDDCELDVLVSWDDGSFNWEKSSNLKRA